MSEPRDPLRVYEPDELGADGYPIAWHSCRTCLGTGWLCAATGGPVSPIASCCVPHGACPSSNGCPACFAAGGCGGAGSIKRMVRAAADHRCVRCRHPYEKGAGEWSRCDNQCRHRGPLRADPDGPEGPFELDPDRPATVLVNALHVPVEARWRILTVHHLNGAKADCRWWNLVALCQRCHLEIQGRVVMDRIWPHEHSEWFKPYVAGFYAWRYLGEEITREQAEARMDELLALEVRQLTLGATA